ncbi:MAG: alpha/beta fold hydrolase [Burkholderiales bacterium]|nr:alpha/beta fold hydrolase [Burkholderiales bacterium]MDE1927637.1 alpha/beta fold hydrolase [Burkholderiales bacterium]MDE2159713.1 alpha/beta fold hydrolase [Burkholderiales bacterium]MDE2502750.1 alpha/beta fold hydrolase [Burkholderiales bacterium]
MHNLILLPGLACDAAMYAGQLPALATRHKVHVADAHQRCATLPEMAAALLREQPGALVLIGASMGGMVALEMLRQAPARVQALALLGTTARPDAAATIELRRKACELYAAGRMDEVLRANLLFAFHPVEVRDKELVGAYLEMLRRAGPAQLIAQNRAVMVRADQRPLLPRIACPTLVVCGEADGLTPVAESRALADAIPGARLEIVAGAGHMLTMEQPARVTALLLHWLDEIRP